MNCLKITVHCKDCGSLTALVGAKSKWLPKIRRFILKVHREAAHGKTK